MIVIDTSALMAIYLIEPEAELFSDIIANADRALIAAPTAFEFRLVSTAKKGPEGRVEADLILAQRPIECVGWTPDLVDLATAAANRYGGRPARLNFGDCMAYALAKSLGAPLLFKGNDFARTDIERVV